jgi:antibiotic biosynthesis monooxygenase (ABM) superfamily enzyme
MPVLAAGWSGNLIVSAIIVFLMVYVVMPRYTRLVAHWLNA